MIGFKQTALVIILASGVGIGSTAQAGGLYNIVDLGTLLDGVNSVGWDINASGQVTGSWRWAGLSYTIERGFVTNNGVMTDVGYVGRAINDSGQVTGWNLGHSAFVITNGVITDLGSLGGNYSDGYGINNSGQVTGVSNLSYGGSGHAFITNNGVMTDLGTLGGSYSSGYAINASGQVAGYSLTSDGFNHAFVTNNGVMADLGTLGGTDSYGLAINASGQVAGFSLTSDGTNHAFVTNNGVMTDLNTLLVADVTDWFITTAYGINDLGQITGSGVHNGLTRAFILTPVSAVPVPGAVWLFTTGLGLLSFNRRKQNS